jgi:uncharacterized surface protein with fasciclin (FAS1) repeats/sporulation protein YlmC with PRC-barrel domain
VRRAKQSKTLAALVLAVSSLASTAMAADLVQAARDAGRFDSFVQALERSGAAETLAGAGPFTLFAPTDEAFRRLPEGVLDGLFGGTDDERLRRLVELHIVPGERHASTALPIELEALDGGRLAITFTGGALTIRAAAPQDTEQLAAAAQAMRGPEARIVTGDIEADNGVIHAIDAVLIPPDLSLEEPPQTAAVEATEPVEAGAEAADEPGATVYQIEPEVVTVPADPQPAAPDPAAGPPGHAPATEAEPQVATAPTQAAGPPEDPPSETVAALPSGAIDQQERAQRAERGLPSDPASAREMIGRTARSLNGGESGTVRDIILSRQSGEVESLVIDFGGFLGLIGQKSVAVDWSQVRFAPDEDELIVELTEEEIEAAPEFDYEGLDETLYEAMLPG